MSDFNLNYGYFSQTSIPRSKQTVNNDSEGRLGRIESDISYIKRDITDIKADMKEFRGEIKDIRKDMREDFRLIFKVMTWGALGLGTLILTLTGVMAKGFGWL